MKKIISNLILTLGVTLLIIYGVNKVFYILEGRKSEEKLQEKILTTSTEEVAYENGDEIGKLLIPSLNISAVIVEGTEDENIKYNIGHFKDTSMVGEDGNFALAGHSSTIYNNVLNSLDKINIEDEIVIEGLSGKFIYKVSEVFEVNPEDTYVLNSLYGKSEITIVTCSNGGKKRLIVKGNLVEE